MLRYLLKRLLLMIPMLFGITLISFALIHLPPGEPDIIGAEMNPKVTKQVREQIRALYDLDKPLHVQYYLWLKRFVKLDFGTSFAQDRRPVISKIAERLPITITIELLSMALIFIIGIPIGVYCARHKDTIMDKILTSFVFAGFAVPHFWLALLLMLFFGVQLELLPISGIKSFNFNELSPLQKTLDMTKHLILPIGISALGGLAGISRYMKNSLLEVLRQEYITTAYAKGLPERVVLRRHALRNALLPVITILGLSVPGLIGGSVIFETIFAIPGMGQLFFAGVMSRDYPTIMGILVMGGVLTLLGNLLADIMYGLADPRIRVG
ncbi:ABC transporter permease [Syntrophorhabdus aromaticivorans]|jgi:peptide/nickel transport system permease protein|uniref:ABC transporter permease n=1 Tax=Syntrophorhabdus aromaticivorans TaxID=328301 RepID=A0A971RZZ4_9BACT|nr:ABC transporter permease [Syntrophorhabdus aromaticivorans]NLW34531.1 ABC transporter permease [Syntrophorhabdus aromaticivorans]